VNEAKSSKTCKEKMRILQLKQQQEKALVEAIAEEASTCR